MQNEGSKEFWKAIKLLKATEQADVFNPNPDIEWSESGVQQREGYSVELFFQDCFNKALPPLTPQSSPLCPGSCPPNFFCNDEEVFDLITHLDISKLTGPDGVSAVMFKSVTSSVSSSLTTLFNLSLSSGVVPDSRKRAHIVPIPKSSKNKSPSNY